MPQFKVLPKEAAQLEELEQRELRRRRTQEAIRQAPPHKQRKYRNVIGKMAADKLNDTQKREKVLKKVYSYNKDVSVSDPMVRGGV